MDRPLAVPRSQDSAAGRITDAAFLRRVRSNLEHSCPEIEEIDDVITTLADMGYVLMTNEEDTQVDTK